MSSMRGFEPRDIRAWSAGPRRCFPVAFVFGCDLIQNESKIAKVNGRTPGKRLLDRIFDLAIIGGGVNGCGIARDAAGRGNSVFLCEMNDLASGTSSWSTKLVHGGLRYLEYYEFRLVREALIEREILWQIAPHIIRPLRFVLPHHAGLRPAWLLRLGLFLYDHIGGRHLLPPTRSVDLARDEVGKPLIANRYTKGFEYSDCFVDDARLVVLTARDAADRGAEIRTRTRAVEIRQADGIWQVTVENTVERRALDHPRPRAGQCRRPLGRAGAGRGLGRQRARQGAAGAGLAHRGAQALRARPRLHVPERRRPHRLRHSLSGRFHADRHHRSRLSRRSRQGESDAGGDRISLRLRQRISRQAGEAGGRGLDLFRRSAAL